MYEKRDYGRMCNLLTMKKKGNTAAMKRMAMEKVKKVGQTTSSAWPGEVQPCDSLKRSLRADAGFLRRSSEVQACTAAGLLWGAV